MARTRKRQVGDFGEDLTIKYLEKNGYKILERNYLKRFGEIDIIALKDELISFVEVKTRKNQAHGYPAEAVNFSKQEKIIKTAQAFLIENNYTDYLISFDVCEVYTESGRINYIENAF
jgi:putative endonuclease